MLNSFRAKMLAGLLAAGGTYYVAPPGFLAAFGIEKPFEVQDFIVPDLAGSGLALSSCRGRPVLVYIWTIGCPASLQNLPMIEVLHEKYRYGQLCFLPISIDRDESVQDDAIPKLKAFAEQYRIPYTIYKGWNYLPYELFPPEFPYVYLIDREGILRKKYSLSIDDRGKLERDLSDMLYDGSPESSISMSVPLSPELVSERREEEFLEMMVKYPLEHEEFEQLETMARELRSTKAYFKRGRRKLPSFYAALKRLPKGTTWEQRLQLFQKWGEAMPASVTARVAAASILTSAAWNARGGGYARDVGEENFRLFKERLSAARTILEEAKNLPESCPELYRVLLLVAQGQGWEREEYERLFAEAVDLDPLYTDLYVEKAEYLLPQWYGRPGEWEKFAETSAEAVKDPAGMELYARIAWNMSRVYGTKGEDLFKKTEISWPRMRQGFIEADKRYPGSLIALNTFAWFACLAGDKETAKGLFARLGDRYDPSVWGNPVLYHRWRNWANGTEPGGILKKLSKMLSS